MTPDPTRAALTAGRYTVMLDVLDAPPMLPIIHVRIRDDRSGSVRVIAAGSGELLYRIGVDPAPLDDLRPHRTRR